MVKCNIYLSVTHKVTFTPITLYSMFFLYLSNMSFVNIFFTLNYVEHTYYLTLYKVHKHMGLFKLEEHSEKKLF